MQPATARGPRHRILVDNIGRRGNQPISARRETILVPPAGVPRFEKLCLLELGFGLAQQRFGGPRGWPTRSEFRILQNCLRRCPGPPWRRSG